MLPPATRGRYEGARWYPSLHPEQPDRHPTVPVFLGLDYSPEAVPLCILDSQGKILSNKDLPDQAAANVATVQRYGIVQGCALEACTGAADRAEELVEQFRGRVPLAHPGFVSRRKQSHDKTDYADARVRADRERVGYRPRVWIAPKALHEVRTLVRERHSLVNQRRARKLPSGARLLGALAGASGRAAADGVNDPMVRTIPALLPVNAAGGWGLMLGLRWGSRQRAFRSTPWG